MAICPPVSGIAPLMALLYQMIKFQPSNKQDYNLACNQAPAIVVCHWSAHRDPPPPPHVCGRVGRRLNTHRWEPFSYTWTVWGVTLAGRILWLGCLFALYKRRSFNSVSPAVLLGVVWSKLRNKRRCLTSVIEKIEGLKDSIVRHFFPSIYAINHIDVYGERRYPTVIKTGVKIAL